MNQAVIDTEMAAAIDCQRRGDLAGAERGYRALLGRHPGYAAAQHNLGIVLMARGQLASGLALIEAVVDADPGNPELADTFRNVGTRLYDAGHWEAARRWLDEALVRAPEDPALHVMVDRVAPRTYLEPETWDPLAGQTLHRYSPREAATYIYTIDIAGTCNLRCPSCPVGNFTAAERTKGFMPLTTFEAIITKIQREKICDDPQVWLFNWGEPLLHPDLPAIIKTVKAAGLSVHVSTNLNTEHGVRGLAKAAPTELKLSLSGFTEETYGFTHRRGDIRLVKANLHLLRYYLDRYGSETRVWVGHHLYRHNAEQVDEVAALCRELRFEHHPVQAFFQPVEKLFGLLEGAPDPNDEPLLAQLLMDPRRTIPHIQRYRSGDYDCELRFNQTVINHDGSVALCCTVYDAPNQLGVHFLDAPHATIERMKYEHPTCARCRSHACDYSVTEPMDQVIASDRID